VPWLALPVLPRPARLVVTWLGWRVVPWLARLVVLCPS
jgi:DMSO/TMAO reductase YedYZ molybdopterin-dependent catalytic subunit